jgi:hypothetical protein
MIEQVKAKLIRSGGRFYWNFKCPSCGDNRMSDAGNYTEDPRKQLGNRTLRCGHLATISAESDEQVNKVLKLKIDN